MGLFGIFSKQKEKVEQGRKSYSSQSLSESVSKKIHEVENSFMKVANERHDEIINIINEIEPQLNAFDNYRLDTEPIDHRLLQILLGNKKNLSERIHSV